MSTYYRPLDPISLKEVKKLDDIEVIYNKEQKKEILFDGSNYLHFDCDKDGNIVDLYRYGGNNESYILETLENNFSTLIVSEYEDAYSNLASEDTNVITIKLEVKNA
jgi:hypothetical protein